MSNTDAYSDFQESIQLAEQTVQTNPVKAKEMYEELKNNCENKKELWTSMLYTYFYKTITNNDVHEFQEMIECYDTLLSLCETKEEKTRIKTEFTAFCENIVNNFLNDNPEIMQAFRVCDSKTENGKLYNYESVNTDAFAEFLIAFPDADKIARKIIEDTLQGHFDFSKCFRNVKTENGNETNSTMKLDLDAMIKFCHLVDGAEKLLEESEKNVRYLLDAGLEINQNGKFQIAFHGTTDDGILIPYENEIYQAGLQSDGKFLWNALRPIWLLGNVCIYRKDTVCDYDKMTVEEQDEYIVLEKKFDTVDMWKERAELVREWNKEFDKLDRCPYYSRKLGINLFGKRKCKSEYKPHIITQMKEWNER